MPSRTRSICVYKYVRTQVASDVIKERNQFKISKSKIYTSFLGSLNGIETEIPSRPEAVHQMASSSSWSE
jgi:hypothetical protein